MIPYFILIALPALFSIVAFKKRLPRSATVATFFGIFLLLLCFRHETVGTDILGYKELAKSVTNMDFAKIISKNSEPVYFLICKIVSLFTENYQIVLVVCAVISIIPLWIFYHKEADSAYLAIVLFATVAPFSMFFSGLRQAMAIALAIPLWYLAKNKKFVWFLIVLFIAYLCHQSAVFMILIYPFYHIRITLLRTILALPCIAVAFLFNNQIFSILLRLVGGEYAEKYGEESQGTGAYTILILLVIFAIYCFVIPDEKKMDQDTRAMRNILLLAVCIQMFAPVHTLAMRVNYYFLIFIPVLISRIPKLSTKAFSQLATLSVAVMSVFFAGYFVYNAYYSADILEIYPYIYFLEG